MIVAAASVAAVAAAAAAAAASIAAAAAAAATADAAAAAVAAAAAAALRKLETKLEIKLTRLPYCDIVVPACSSRKRFVPPNDAVCGQRGDIWRPELAKRLGNSSLRGRYRVV